MFNPPAERKSDEPAARLEIVRSVWREVLEIDHVGDDVTFFDAGGDSLRLVVLVERLNEASGRTLRTIDLFRAGTVRGQAELLVGEAEPTARGFRSVSREQMLRNARLGNAAAPR